MRTWALQWVEQREMDQSNRVSTKLFLLIFFFFIKNSFKSLSYLPGIFLEKGGDLKMPVSSACCSVSKETGDSVPVGGGTEGSG